MDFLKLRTVQWITIMGSIGTVISLLALWNSPYRLLFIVLTVALPFATGLLEIQKDRISVFYAGIRKYHRVFPIERNSDIFNAIRTEYCYFGISFASVLNTFRVWYASQERRANVRIRLLLVDPNADEVLEFQARYERNLWGDNLTSAERNAIDDTVKRVKDSIALVLDTIAALPPSNPPIEVYFHTERVRKWVHIVNDNLLYAGMLPLGSDGLQTPVLELKKHPGTWRIFDYYYDECEGIRKVARAAKISRLP